MTSLLDTKLSRPEDNISVEGWTKVESDFETCFSDTYKFIKQKQHNFIAWLFELADTHSIGMTTRLKLNAMSKLPPMLFVINLRREIGPHADDLPAFITTKREQLGLPALSEADNHRFTRYLEMFLEIARQTIAD
jgi:hypothetical protein